MTVRIIKVELKSGSGATCDECQVDIMGAYYRKIFPDTPNNIWGGVMCVKCMETLDVLYEYYVEIPGALWTDTYYDLATLKICWPRLVPRLEKI